ncbi:MAG: cell division protein FtsA [Mollicutes bacterium]|nr:cell division protein FtsA [Mollicutes bacterium]
MKKIYTSVDIGSDTIKVVVCELFKNRLNLLAATSVKSSGIKKGVITDVEKASVSLRKAFEEIETMLGVKIKRVIASVPSYFAEYTYAEGTVEIINEEKVITGDDVIRCLHEGIKTKVKSNYEIITVIPIDFSIDGQEPVKNPKGLKGNSLSSRMILVTTPKKNVYSVVNLIESIGVSVEDISLNNIGDIYIYKNSNTESKLGVIINIGSEITTVSLYNKNIIVKSSIIGLGGKNVDNDLAYIYKISNEQATRIKEKFALGHKRYASLNDFYEVATKNKEVISINQFEASEIVMSRLEEILTLAKKEINLLTNKKIHYIIITGGMSNMAHLKYTVDDVFGKVATIGSIKVIGVRDNKYSSALGNIVYFIDKLKMRQKEYSMFSKEDAEEISSVKKGLLNITNDSMLGKVFGYFWSD